MGINLKKVAKRSKGYQYILLIMRHAKAEPFTSASDRDRTITEKGVKQAKLVAEGLTQLRLVPDAIACSSAVRAQQTLGRMLRVFGDGPNVDYRQSLYQGGVQAILDEISHAKESAHVFMVLAHEPTVSISCQWIASSQSDPALLDLLNIGMSTASVAVFGADVPFTQWKVHTGDLLAVLSPKDFDR